MNYFKIPTTHTLNHPAVPTSKYASSSSSAQAATGTPPQTLITSPLWWLKGSGLSLTTEQLQQLSDFEIMVYADCKYRSSLLQGEFFGAFAQVRDVICIPCYLMSVIAGFLILH